MSSEVIAALIGAGAVVIAALITSLVSARVQEGASSKYRRNLGLVEPQGRWECAWYNEDGSPYVSDIIEIADWVKNGRFKGRGIQANLSYTVQGEIDSTRAMALTYRTEDFPKTAYAGVAFLIFDVDGDNLSGRWYGRTRTGELAGGKTVWRRNTAKRRE